MLIAAGGGGAGGTPWGLMTVPDMQALIQNPDIPAHYELLTGWKRSADLLIEHRWQVQNYRDNLAAAWPPEKNEASAAYLARLDALIANLSDTYEAALSNHDAFAAATLSLSLAQKEMAEIAAEYEANERSLAAFTAQHQPANGRPQPTPSPSGEQPPVAPGRQEELHQRAATLLSGVSADLAQAQLRIRTPQPYKPTGHEDDEAESADSFVAPPISPITPQFATDTSPPRDRAQSSLTFPMPPSTSPAAAPQPAPPQPGLVLGGAAPQTPGITPLAPTAPGASGPTATPPSSSSVAPVNFLPGGQTFAPPISGHIGRNTGAVREGPGRLNITTPGANAMPPGGIIGGLPASSGAQSIRARPVGTSVNPVGGIIGGAPQARTSGNGTPGAHSASTGPISHSGGRTASRRDSASQISRDADNPWQTASGVDPVVLPPREKRIDPGPAIGLA